MASKARRITRSLRIAVLAGIPILIAAWFVAPIFFPRWARVRAWTPPGVSGAASWKAPVFPETRTSARPLLLFECPPMDPATNPRRMLMLRERLATEHLGPLLLQTFHMPGASLTQKARILDELPARCSVILEISLADLARAVPMPRLLPTHHGSFPGALWPLRRGGAPQENQSYQKIAETLRTWKQKIEARNGQLILLYLPRPLECDSQRLASEMAILGLDSSQLQSTRAGRRLGDLCRELDILYVDPTLLLRGSAKAQRPIFVDVEALPYEARYTERAERLILGRLARQGIRKLFD